MQLAQVAAHIGRAAQVCNMSSRREIQAVFERMEQLARVTRAPAVAGCAAAQAATVAGTDATATRRAVQNVFSKMHVEETFRQVNDCSTTLFATDNAVARQTAVAEKQRSAVNSVFNLMNGEAAQANTKATRAQRVSQNLEITLRELLATTDNSISTFGLLEHGSSAHTGTTINQGESANAIFSLMHRGDTLAL